MSNTKTNEMKALTNEQKDLFNTLVRLGDSKDIALKTVLEQKKTNSKMYEIAYCS